MVTGGGPRGEEDKETEKRFLFIKAEVTGLLNKILALGPGVGRMVGSSEV